MSSNSSHVDDLFLHFPEELRNLIATGNSLLSDLQRCLTMNISHNKGLRVEDANVSDGCKGGTVACSHMHRAVVVRNVHGQTPLHVAQQTISCRDDVAQFLWEMQEEVVNM